MANRKNFDTQKKRAWRWRRKRRRGRTIPNEVLSEGRRRNPLNPMPIVKRFHRFPSRLVDD